MIMVANAASRGDRSPPPALKGMHDDLLERHPPARRAQILDHAADLGPRLLFVTFCKSGNMKIASSQLKMWSLIARESPQLR